MTTVPKHPRKPQQPAASSYSRKLLAAAGVVVILQTLILVSLETNNSKGAGSLLRSALHLPRALSSIAADADAPGDMDEETLQLPTTIDKENDEEGDSTSSRRRRILQQQIDMNKNRTIGLVHVGKAGGSTLRKETAAHCQIIHAKAKANRTEKIQECMDKRFTADQKLALQTRYYFHVHDFDDTLANRSTSFLVPIRNPVDRIISTYKYSHPGNCNNHTAKHRIRGCLALEYKAWRQPNSTTYQLFRKCFPSPAMEEFAQSVSSPWRGNSHFRRSNLTKQEKMNCRLLAKQVVSGQHRDHKPFDHPVPHMVPYNYQYYASKSMWQYPKKEVFVIRTEHEWDDMVELDILLGGSGNFTQRKQKDIKHGSDKYHKSPLSQEAYSKLCCVLENEILIYKDILDQALNLSPEQKEESMNDVKDKCGIDKATSWPAWRTTCKDQLALDQEVLTKNWDEIMPTRAAAAAAAANDNKHLPYPSTTTPSTSNTTGAPMINVSATVSKPNFKATTKDLLRSSEQGLGPTRGGSDKNSTVKKNTNSGAVPEEEEEEEEEE
jgi:hypothetical protein